MHTVVIKDNRELLIREAEGDDAAEILDYLKIIVAETDNLTFGPGEFSLSVEEEREFLESVKQLKNNIYIVGIIDNQIVSVANITASNRPRLKHYGELSISVRKDYWRMGIGRAMMQYLIDWARDTGIRKINLDVRADHQGAIQLYEQLGFERIGISTSTMYIKREFVDTFIMGLEVDP